jgi:hypothetical protein
MSAAPAVGHARHAVTLAVETALVVAVGLAGTGCAGSRAPAPAGAPTAGAADTARRPARQAPRDTTAGLPPAGYGTLRQDALSLRLGHLDALQVRATPLDESVIRLLSPDSYRALAELKRSKADAIAQVARRNGVRDPSVWYVSFFTVQRGDTRLSPREFIVTNVGRDFRPLDILPLTPGFGEQRLRQNGRQDALYVFDGLLDVQQPLTVAYETTRNDDWASILPTLERERSLVKSRAAAGRSP